MEHNYHKLSENDAVILKSALDAYVLQLKKDKENVLNRRIKSQIDYELRLAYETISSFNNSLNIEEE